MRLLQLIVPLLFAAPLVAQGTAAPGGPQTNATATPRPRIWNRADDWVPHLAVNHTTTLGNPAVDHGGNLVWNYERVKIDAQAIPFDARNRTPMQSWWQLPWWTNIWSHPVLGAQISSYNLVDSLQTTFSQHPAQHKPIVRWENVFGQSLNMNVTGKLRLWWDGSPVAKPVTVEVVIAVLDDSAGFNVVTPIFSGAFDKPTPVETTFAEYIDIPVSLSNVLLDPNDSIVVTFEGRTGFHLESVWVSLEDNKLNYSTTDLIPYASQSVGTGDVFADLLPLSRAGVEGDRRALAGAAKELRAVDVMRDSDSDHGDGPFRKLSSISIPVGADRLWFVPGVSCQWFYETNEGTYPMGRFGSRGSANSIPHTLAAIFARRVFDLP